MGMGDADCLRGAAFFISHRPRPAQEAASTPQQRGVLAWTLGAFPEGLALAFLGMGDDTFELGVVVRKGFAF